VILLTLVGLAACSGNPGQPIVTAPALLDPTTQPAPTSPPPPTPSPVPAPFNVWIAPALPATLRDLTLQALEAAPERFLRVESPEQAVVRVEARPDRPLADWIYAAAAPFPTLEDSLSMEQLRALWEGGQQQPAVLLSQSTAEALRPQLGEPAGAALRQTGETELLDAAWALGESRALLPFEELEPRWKVLEVEGQNPLHLDFDTRLYPLIVPFGLSGEPEAVAQLEAALKWPASNREREQLTVVLMTGVTALVRTTSWQMEQRGVLFPAQDVGAWLRDADLTHVSNEVSFSEACPFPDPYTSLLRFCSLPAHIALFEDIGVDLVELTGNHLLDWGEPAFQYTLGLYAERGWQTFGGGATLDTSVQPVLVEHHGNRLAFLGCNAAGPAADWATSLTGGAAPCHDPRLLEQVASLRAEGYLPIFTYQWAESLSPRPLPDQVIAFQQAAEAGAVIVSGSQAHRPQALEFHAGSLIHYGLGNLFFDQMHTFSYRQEFLDRHVFYQGRHLSTELLTAMLEDYARPRPMQPGEREQLLREIFAASGW
jgi:poly-gamma-glutamate synthesis protein (capsule biosynthesis protein)